MSQLTEIQTRDARADDVEALAALRYGHTMHRDRVRDADGTTMRYLVAVEDDQVVGFGVLVLAQPPAWPAMRHIPQMVDLYVKPERRSRGIGTCMIRTMEQLAAAAGSDAILLGVDPESNARALALYQRLGYESIDKKPVEDRWSFTDSDGVVHRGVERIIHMRKML